MPSLDRSLDTILVQIGEFGKHQKFTLFLICISVVCHASVNVFYVFSAMGLKYRCKITECEVNNASDYSPEWLQNAVPFDEHIPAKCEKFARKNLTALDCTADEFDRDNIEKCNSFVYETEDTSIVKDFDIHCNENTWKLTVVGTINHAAQFVALPFVGMISDRYGRRTVLILGNVFCGLSGIIKSFMTSYSWFLVFEFFDAFFGAGMYSCAFILGVELVGPSKRTPAGMILSFSFAVGEITLGVIAWYMRSWRSTAQILYTASCMLIIYFWLTPESIRWLLANKKSAEAVTVLRSVAKVNGKAISEDSLAKLTIPEEETDDSVKYPLRDVFKSKILMLRFINCCFTWITCAFLFYGLILNSVALATNPYLNFILTSTVEIPAYLTLYYLLDRIGRRTCQSGAFFITGLACLTFIFLKKECEWLRLTAYLLGKFGATAAFVVCYVITSEMFPTSLRHSLLGSCSMIGRIGSILSPQMPLLAQIWTSLPLILFTVMAGTAGLLALLFPETLNIKLPDTVEEAENIGKSTNSKDTELVGNGDSSQANTSSEHSTKTKL